MKMPHEELLKYPNVIGYGHGYKRVNGNPTSEKALVVLVTEKLPEIVLSPDDRIPAVFSEQLTDVLVVGIVRALQNRTGRFRPAPGGVSIGHKDITAGTFGVLATDDITGNRVILSNNHVLANSNQAKFGDAILQPGPIDGGNLNDTIASLTRFVPIQFDGAGNGCLPFLNRAVVQQTNLVDAAIATPILDSDVTDRILDIGLISRTMPAILQMPVKKSGRTTALTHSSVQLIDATVKVQYGGGNIATFTDQIITGPMSQGGDSGSLLVHEEEGSAVGLLYAGSSSVTIHNKINNVTNGLGITI